MSYEVYKVLHLLGILTLLGALGGACVLAISGKGEELKPTKRLLMIMHGLAVVVILVAGFGLMARKGIGHGGGWPTWIYGKFAIWLVLGASVGFIRRSADRATVWLLLVPLVGAAAAWLAVVQPG